MTEKLANGDRLDTARPSCLSLAISFAVCEQQQKKQQHNNVEIEVCVFAGHFDNTADKVSKIRRIFPFFFKSDVCVVSLWF